MAEEAPPRLYNNTLAETMARMERHDAALQALRKQKPYKPDRSFLPSRAYCLLGHGEQPTEDVFRVPQDCIIVVKALPGEELYYKNLYKHWNILFDPWRRSVYENPLCYIPKLIEKFGSLMIYKPGDICPNFNYYLGPNTDPSELNLTDGKIAEEDNNPRKVFCNEYGLIELGKTSHRIRPITIDVNAPFKNVIESLYKNSIVPNVRDFVVWLGKENFNTKTFKELVNSKSQEHPGYSAPFYPGDYTMTQKDLLNINPATGKARRTGVYYNFICRSNPQSSAVYEFNANFNANRLKSSIVSYTLAPPEVKNLLGQRLLEAEKRKQFLKGTKFNRPASKRRDRKSKQHRTRKNRK